MADVSKLLPFYNMLSFTALDSSNH